MALSNWLREGVGVYFGNASATRDYRVQLRGNRAVLLWAFYLLVLIGFTMIVYANTAEDGARTSIVMAQSKLRGFYQNVMILLAVMVNVITPALTAGAIVMERQRHSLDLVFSAPVSPRYLLVGKMISSYRYTWMLLILSVPVTSACVVLGGATWSDVIAAYLIMSFTALVYTSIALLLSTLAKQPVSAVIWSYVAAIFYSILSAAFIGSSSIGMMGSRTMEAPFVIGINPYLAVQAAPTYTILWENHVPNWLLGGMLCLLICRLMVVGAASALSGFGSKETKSLRIHGLVYAVLYLSIAGYSIGSTVSMMTTMMRSSGGTTPPGSSASWNVAANMAFGWLLAPLVILIPFLTCYAKDSERKFWPDGLFSFRRMFLGTPSGALPYIWSMIVLGFLGMTGILKQYGAPLPSPAMLFWALSLWTFFWSLGRFSSGLNVGLRSARALHFTIMMALIALPVPFFSVASTFDASSSNIWDIYILRPLLGGRDNTAICLIMGGVLLVAATLMTYIAETNAARKGILQSKAA